MANNLSYEVLQGNSIDVLRTLDKNSVQCCVTSPPYWDQRNYDHPDQLGQENTLEEYIVNLCDVFDGVWDALADDGVFWLNIGDKYDDKDLMGIPWRVALELKNRGWILRNDIIWHKPDSLPVPLKDRCNSCHEMIFMFTKNKKYYYDIEAIMEPLKDPTAHSTTSIGGNKHSARGESGVYTGKKGWDARKLKGKIRRDVWTIATARSKEQHFAVFPEKIPELCIKASTREGDIVLDPFSGSGTTGVVAKKLGRSYIGVELNEDYAIMSRKRIESIVNLNGFLA